MTGSKPLLSWESVHAPKKPKGPQERFVALKDEPLREFVRTLPCLVSTGRGYGKCGGLMEAAHVTSKGAAGGDENNLVPLCGYHHHQQHMMGVRSFAYRYQVRLRAAARKITSSWLSLEKSFPRCSPRGEP